jgi:ribosomal protein L9
MTLKITDMEKAQMAPVLAAFRANAKQTLHAAHSARASQADLRETLRQLHNRTESELRAIFGEVRAKDILEALMKQGDELQRRVAQ